MATLISAIKSAKQTLKTVFQRQPSSTLGLTPKIKTTADVEMALEELSWMVGVGLAVQALLTAHIRSLRTAYVKYLHIPIGKTEVSHEDRTKHIEEGLETCHLEHPEWFDGKKSRKYAEGTCGFRKSRGTQARVGYADGHDRDTVHCELVQSGCEAINMVRWVAEDVAKHTGTIVSLFDVRIEINMGVALALRDAGRLTDEQLAALHLVYSPGTPGGDRFYAKPRELQIQAEPKAAA